MAAEGEASTEYRERPETLNEISSEMWDLKRQLEQRRLWQELKEFGGSKGDGENVRRHQGKARRHFSNFWDFQPYHVIEWFNFKKRKATIILKETRNKRLWECGRTPWKRWECGGRASHRPALPGHLATPPAHPRRERDSEQRRGLQSWECVPPRCSAGSDPNQTPRVPNILTRRDRVTFKHNYKGKDGFPQNEYE